MKILVNGQPRQHDGQPTVAALLEAMSLDPLRVAVEHNRRIVPRADYGRTNLGDGDELEIVSLVGGG